jgi:hypothetical protein
VGLDAKDARDMRWRSRAPGHWLGLESTNNAGLTAFFFKNLKWTKFSLKMKVVV